MRRIKNIHDALAQDIDFRPFFLTYTLEAKDLGLKLYAYEHVIENVGFLEISDIQAFAQEVLNIEYLVIFDGETDALYIAPVVPGFSKDFLYTELCKHL